MNIMATLEGTDKKYTIGEDICQMLDTAVKAVEIANKIAEEKKNSAVVD
jgi:hypothetical protein